MLTTKDNFLYYLSCLLAFAYIVMMYVANGVILPSVYLSIALLSFVIVAILYAVNTKAGIFSGHTKWLLLFTLAALICSTYSPQDDFLPLRNILVALIVACLFQILVKDERSFLIISYSYAIASFIGCVFYYSSGMMILDAYSRFGEEMSGNANVFAGLVMISTMIDIWLCIYGTRKIIVRILLVFFTLFNFYALTLSGGRGSFVVPLVFLYSLVIFKTASQNKMKTLLSTAIFIIVVIVVFNILMQIPEFYYSIGFRFESIINPDAGNAGVMSSDDIREKLRQEAFSGFFHSPIWGHGLDSFRFHSTGGNYSHCNYVELLYNGGLLFFLIYYNFYYKIVKIALKDNDIIYKYRAFAFSVISSLLIYDYIIVSYDLLPVHIMLAIAYSCLNFKEKCYE